MLTINDAFDYVNNSGTQNPASNLIYTSAATRDSFFGETSNFNGNTNQTGGFTLTNLNPSKYYSFSIFASRMGVSDNRETLYTVTGITTNSNTLNTANNTTNTADIINIQPEANGIISFETKKGANNNNSFGFFYLGAIKMIISDTPISNINEPILLLEYPNGNEIWEENKTPYISWFNHGVDNIDISYSTNNGNSWNLIATVQPTTKKYNWTIPSDISNQCLVKIEASSIIDTSQTAFSIINNKNVVYNIVILGSSTAAGTGPTDINNAWVWRYEDYLTQNDTRYNVENLAVGGFTTYNLLPTGSTIPSGINQTVATENNITKAITLQPNGIIINLPSNDAAHEYSVTNQIANYNLMKNSTVSENIPLWISTPQPKDFSTNTNALTIQLDMVTQTPIEFGNFTVDFWTDFGISSGNGLLEKYNADGTHMNDIGHLKLFQRVIDKDIHTIVKQQVDASLNTSELDFEILDFEIYPNPVLNKMSISINLFKDTNLKIEIFNTNGQLIKTLLNEVKKQGKYIEQFYNLKDVLSKGMYFCKVTTLKSINSIIIIVK